MVDNTFGVLFRLSLGAGGGLLIITVTFLSGIKQWEIHLCPNAGGEILADYEEERRPFTLLLPFTSNRAEIIRFLCRSLETCIGRDQSKILLHFLNLVEVQCRTTNAAIKTSPLRHI